MYQTSFLVMWSSGGDDAVMPGARYHVSLMLINMKMQNITYWTQGHDLVLRLVLLKGRECRLGVLEVEEVEG